MNIQISSEESTGPVYGFRGPSSLSQFSGDLTSTLPLVVPIHSFDLQRMKYVSFSDMVSCKY